MAHSIGLALGALLITVSACAPRAAELTSAPAETSRQMLISNATSARIEVYLVPAAGPAKLLGELRAGAAAEVAVPVGKHAPFISAYIGSGVTRTSVSCTVPVE